MRYTIRTDGTSWKTIRKIVKFSGSQINAIYKIITSKNKNSIEIISTWWFLFWLFLTVFQSLIFLHSFVYTNVYIFYVCDCFHLAAYFSFSFLFAFVICCVRAFFVGRGRGGGRFIGFMWCLWRMRGIAYYFVETIIFIYILSKRPLWQSHEFHT